MNQIINYYVDMWKNFANFSGRTTVAGYWWAYLVNFIVSTVIGFIPYVGFIYGLVAIIPGLAITVRRLNDAGKHWAWIFISLVPLAGAIILIVMLCKPSVNSNIVESC
jgi:uncharacterized membrane protein YhaH (DUF805 family)